MNLPRPQMSWLFHGTTGSSLKPCQAGSGTSVPNLALRVCCFGKCDVARSLSLEIILSRGILSLTRHLLHTMATCSDDKKANENQSSFQKMRAHVKEFVEASPEEHKK